MLILLLLALFVGGCTSEAPPPIHQSADPMEIYQNPPVRSQPVSEKSLGFGMFLVGAFTFGAAKLSAFLSLRK